MSVAVDVKARGAQRLRERAKAQLLLDANADMPVREDALAEYLDAASLVAHPAEARRRAAHAYATIAEVLGCEPAQLHFTSGGTEADAVALHTLHAGGERPLAVSTIEHAAVARTAALWSTQAGRSVVRLPVGRDGLLVLDALSTLPRGAGVSVVAASNETGAIQPVDAIADRVHALGGLLHCDAAQLPGRAALQVSAADLVSYSAHKVGAPGGLGLVVARDGVTRPTLSAPELGPSIIAFAKALSALPDANARAAITASRDAIERGLREKLEGVWFVASEVPRLANTSCVGFTGCDGDAVMMALDVRGIAVSTGSACSSGSIEPSPILLGMGLTPREAKSTIRVSLPRALSADETRHVVDTITEVVLAARAMLV